MTAYQVLVASSHDLLRKDHGDLWDSGKVESDQSVNVEYQGKSLTSGMRCFWKVRVWSQTSELRPPTSSQLSVSSDQLSENTDHRSLISDHAPLYLDLGTVKESAKANLNGKDLGVVWCNPWRVHVTRGIKPGENTLEIEIVNNWHNRLIGDQELPESERRTRTSIGAFKRGAALTPSSSLLSSTETDGLEKRLGNWDRTNPRYRSTL